MATGQPAGGSMGLHAYVQLITMPPHNSLHCNKLLVIFMVQIIISVCHVNSKVLELLYKDIQLEITINFIPFEILLSNDC